MLTIIVCDSDSAVARSVSGVAESMAGTRVMRLESIEGAVAQLTDARAQVLVVGPAVPTDAALDAARTIRLSGASGTVLLVVRAVTSDLLREAMRAGVSDVLESTASVAEIEASLRSAMSVAARPASPESESAGSAEVVTVFSTKGGVGKTVVATNLAVAIAQEGHSVALVDLDLQFGDVGIMLGLEPTRTIIGAVQSAERLDAAMLDGFMLDHSSGVKVLLAPTQPEDAEMVTASRIDRIVRLLASQYEFVVIDTPPTLDESVLTALDCSSRVIAITMMDIASIKNTRISLQKLKQLGYNGSLVDVMLNRADSKVYLRPENVEEAIGMPIKYRLPSDAQVPRAVNKGLPVVVEAPRSQPARVLISTAKSIIAERKEVRGHVA